MKVKKRRPVYGMALPHWTYEETINTFGTPHDAFCIQRRYHVLVTRNVPTDPGWHVSFRPWCSEKYEGNPAPAIARDEWFTDVMAFFGLVGVKWDEEHTSEKGVVHFHERIGS